MFQKKDAAHLKAIDEMGELMEASEAMKDWFESVKKAFDELPEDEKVISDGELNCL